LFGLSDDGVAGGYPFLFGQLPEDQHALRFLNRKDALPTPEVDSRSTCRGAVPMFSPYEGDRTG